MGEAGRCRGRQGAQRGCSYRQGTPWRGGEIAGIKSSVFQFNSSTASKTLLQHVPHNADALLTVHIHEVCCKKKGFTFSRDGRSALTLVFFLSAWKIFFLKSQTAKGSLFSVTKQLEATKQFLSLDLPPDKDLCDRNNLIGVRISPEYNPGVFWELLGFCWNPTGCQSTLSSFNYSFR